MAAGHYRLTHYKTTHYQDGHWIGGNSGVVVDSTSGLVICSMMVSPSLSGGLHASPSLGLDMQVDPSMEVNLEANTGRC